MVLGAVAETAEGLFTYHRGNFLYDRKLRQEQEIGILEFRTQQAELWREDIRDIFEMTQKKMDNYAIVTALLCDMCVAFFTEGRLERQTPVWLLYFYMITLGSAFMYLLMSLWFSMQASVVANCSSVRLLTQFVRLPVPTWKQIEDMRTYGSSYESLSTSNMLRIPLLQRSASVTPHDTNSAVGDDAVAGSASRPAVRTTAPPQKRDGAVDPWGLERYGDARALSELQDIHPALRPHIALARSAAVEYQGFDAFARVSLSFGITHFLYAILYYCLGYAAIELGSLWPAWCIAVILTATISAVMSVDFSPTQKKLRLATIFASTGPLCGAIATSIHWLSLGEKNHIEGSKKVASQTVIAILISIAYASHALWLLWALGACGMKKQANGAVIPTKFRAVLYLDIFGWIRGQPQLLEQQAAEPCGRPRATGDSSGGGLDASPPPPPPPPQEHIALLRLQEDLLQDLSRWQGELEQQTLTADEEARVTNLMIRAKKLLASVAVELGQQAPTRAAPAVGHSGPSPMSQAAELMQDAAAPLESDDLGIAHSFHQTVAHAFMGFFDLFQPRADYRRLFSEHDVNASDELSHSHSFHSGLTETQAVRKAPAHLIFAPATFAPRNVRTRQSHRTVRHYDPGRFPARAFYGATIMVLLLWVAGCMFCRILACDPIEEYPTIAPSTDEGSEGANFFMDSMQGSHKYETLPSFFPESVKEELESLPKPISVEVTWPEHEGFFPRALSSDASGTRLVVADDFGLYHATLKRLEGKETKSELRGAAERLEAKFRPLQVCSGIEGQGLEDMTVSCLANSSCLVFVLLRKGKQFIECSLPDLSADSGSTSVSEKENVAAEETTEVAGDDDNNTEITWTIAQEWLATGHPAEQVDAIAVNSQCLHSSKSKARDFETVGCVLVGTTGGRVLQLRRHLTEDRVLVPARTIYRQQRPVAHGGLNSLENGMVVALSQKQGKEPAVVLALNSQDGSVRGTWKLPEKTAWLTFSGGGSSLFALGIREGYEPELFKFPRPREFGEQDKPQEGQDGSMVMSK